MGLEEGKSRHGGNGYECTQDEEQNYPAPKSADQNVCGKSLHYVYPLETGCKTDVAAVIGNNDVVLAHLDRQWRVTLPVLAHAV